MRLSDIYSTLARTIPGGQADVTITSLTVDSRQVQPGACFIAVRGGAQDGHRFIPEARAGGAAVILGEDPDPRLGGAYIQVEDSRLALAQLAATWHGHPARSLVMIGVTGTDGKSTTCNL
ncbi:MAG: Mur ligase domain-containing protein, partial [Anaerolineales bacterium]|nr:Mur ligase domain-containing protein [Anaerolineales bacterium]